MHLLTPPAVEPVDILSVKAALRIDDDRFDDQLPGLISAARAVAEQETGRQFVQQTWRTELVDWPGADVVFHVHRATACAVSYWNGSAWATLAGVVFAPNGAGTSIAPALGTSWPALGEVAIGPRVRVDITSGVEPSQVADVPGCVVAYITAVVGQMVQSPELMAMDAAQAHPLLARLLDSQRLYY